MVSKWIRTYIVIKAIYSSYNPLILTFDPNFQQDIRCIPFFESWIFFPQIDRTKTLPEDDAEGTKLCCIAKATGQRTSDLSHAKTNRPRKGVKGTCILVIQTVTFLGWWFHVTPFKGLKTWPPTIGDEKGTAWITWYFGFFFGSSKRTLIVFAGLFQRGNPNHLRPWHHPSGCQWWKKSWNHKSLKCRANFVPFPYAWPFYGWNKWGWS